MRKSLSIVLLLVAALGAAWIWFSGDTKPLQFAYWKNMVHGWTSSGSSPATAAVVGQQATKTSTQAKDTVTTALATIGSPVGRYVTTKAATKRAPAAVTTTLARLGSPTGRYIEAPMEVAAVAAPVKVALNRTSSPIGRYVKAPVMKKAAAPSKITRISSPGGRYVKAPAVVKKAAAPRKITRISSPGGRYVKAPTVVKRAAPPSEIARISSPAGRYVKGPATTAAAPKKAVVFPITFEYRKSSFTKKGREAADQLLQYITTKGYSSITLAGHTDSRGSQKVNMAISERRLNSVAKHLRNNGYKGGINLIPKGKSEPYQGVDRSKLSNEELFEVDRRVELVSGS